MMKYLSEVLKLGPMVSGWYEGYLFSLASKYCPTYSGGSWTSKRIGNTWIAVPPVDGKVEIVNPDNGATVSVYALTFGACLTVIALNRLMWDLHARNASDHIIEGLSKLWDQAKDNIYEAKDSGIDLTAFTRFID